ncbi:hypothetical protein BDV39DRAFT_178206 [Aspergillus sergii]|uniref:Uncharacterized protein n=1 Tax=Aspergillus sergii TaxID=1034303 RepID=A0A5N6WYP7_9EURO|nr:hypothetical protein BDV39DRAFT_178206 [Aspergillus sergii]
MISYLKSASLRVDNRIVLQIRSFIGIELCIISILLKIYHIFQLDKRAPTFHMSQADLTTRPVARYAGCKGGMNLEDALSTLHRDIGRQGTWPVASNPSRIDPSPRAQD